MVWEERSREAPPYPDYGTNDMNISLIGLNHCHQLVGHANASKKFRYYLKDHCLKEQPDLIAEELSEDAIKQWKARDSVARKIAKTLRVRHLFCDPSIDERKALGIKSWQEIVQELGYGPVLKREQSLEVDKIEKSHWEARERFWLDKLIEQQSDRTVFLVGADHVDRFVALLAVNGIQTIIINGDWQP